MTLLYIWYKKRKNYGWKCCPNWKKKGFASKKGGGVSTHTQTLIRGRLKLNNVSKNGSNSGHACLVIIILIKIVVFS